MHQQEIEMQKQEQKQDYVTGAQLELQSRQVDNQQAEVMRNYEADKEELAQKYDASMKEYEFKFTELIKDLQFKYDELAAKSETEEAKIIGDATKANELESIRQAGNMPANEQHEEMEEENEQAESWADDHH